MGKSEFSRLINWIELGETLPYAEKIQSVKV